MPEAWKSQEYHAKRFLSSKSQQQVLRRYANVEVFRDVDDLQRHACHVCLWILHLACDGVTARVGELSPLDVLTRMLQGCNTAPLKQRLRAYLEQVLCHAEQFLEEHSFCKKSGDCWEQLHRTISLTLLCAEESRGEHDINMSKEVMPVAVDIAESKSLDVDPRRQRMCKKMIKHQHQYRNSTDKLQDVAALLSTALKACREENALVMCEVLLKVVACLTKPMLRGQTREGSAMSEAAKQELRSCLQTTLRKTVLVCLGGLDLEDNDTRQRTDVQTSLQHIKFLVEGVDIDQAMSRKQWLAINEFLVRPRGTELSSESIQRKRGEHLNELASIFEGRYTPSKNVRALRWVQKREKPVELRCVKCQETITACWSLIYKGKDMVLIPHNGHGKCKALYLPPGGVKFKRDTPSHFPCEHGHSFRRNCETCSKRGGAGPPRKMLKV